MPGSVIRRLGHTVTDDGLIHYQEEAGTWDEADALAGRRVDRRRRYAILHGGDDGPQLCEAINWTERCSGCSDGYSDGSGCQECCYRGVRRNGAWVPLSTAEHCRTVAAE